MHWPHITPAGTALVSPSVAGKGRLVGLGGGGALVGHEQVLGCWDCVPPSTWLTLGLLLFGPWVDGSLVDRAS